MAANVGDILAGRYRLDQHIGGGGMGQVWRARDLTLDRDVAVKTVDLNHSDATVAERFRREAVATSRLRVPEVVQVFDAGTDGQTSYLVMELLSGPSLQQMIAERGALPLSEGLLVAREVAKGLIAAHTIGVVHRDIKPGNVMFNGDEVKLVDFGIAQLSERLGPTLTATATAMGTAAYMAPEQATGEGATQASDWYALGCLLTTVFTGRPPFEGPAVQVAMQQVDGRPPRLRERDRSLPQALDDLVAALLRKDPITRPTGPQVLDQIKALEVDPAAETMVLRPVTQPATREFAMPPTLERTAYAQSQLDALEEDRPRSRWPYVLIALAVVAGLASVLWWVLGHPGDAAGHGVPTATPQVTQPANRPSQPAIPVPGPSSSAPPPAAPSAKGKPSATATRTPSASPSAQASSDAAGVYAAIGKVSDKGAQKQLLKAYRPEGDNEEFGRTVDKLESQGKLAPDEAADLLQAAGLTS